MTRVMYRYKSYGKQVAPNRYEVELKSVDAYSVFLPEESWWHHRDSQALLDHEQGHFDIAEIAARRIELTFRKSLASGRTIQGVGTTLERANQALEVKLKKVFDLANEQSVEENLDYDRQTVHGLHTGQQSEFRRIQKLTLKKLEKQLAPKSKRDPRRAAGNSK